MFYFSGNFLNSLHVQIYVRLQQMCMTVSNSGTLVPPFMGFFAVSIDPLLTNLNIDGVNNLFTSLTRDLVSVLSWMLAALLLLLVFTVRTTGVSMVTRPC